MNCERFLGDTQGNSERVLFPFNSESVVKQHALSILWIACEIDDSQVDLVKGSDCVSAFMCVKYFLDGRAQLVYCILS